VAKRIGGGASKAVQRGGAWHAYICKPFVELLARANNHCGVKHSGQGARARAGQDVGDPALKAIKSVTLNFSSRAVRA